MFAQSSFSTIIPCESFSALNHTSKFFIVSSPNVTLRIGCSCPVVTQSVFAQVQYPCLCIFESQDPTYFINNAISMPGHVHRFMYPYLQVLCSLRNLELCIMSMLSLFFHMFGPGIHHHNVTSIIHKVHINISGETFIVLNFGDSNRIGRIMCGHYELLETEWEEQRE